MRAVDLIGEPPTAHQLQAPDDRRRIGGLLEGEVKREGEERKPDLRGVAVDVVNRGRQHVDGGGPVGSGEPFEMRRQRG